MQHKSTIELTKAGIRARICTRCYQRPDGSESLDAMVPRSCESHCTIFANLPQVAKAVVESSGELSADEILQSYVCPACNMSASAGEFCADRLARTCPLSRYAGDVINILEHSRRSTQAAAAVALSAEASGAPLGTLGKS